MKAKKRLKLIVLLFAMTLLVGTAFASANGALIFNGTVRINNVHTVQEARLEFISASINGPSRDTVSITAHNVLTYDISVTNIYNAPPDINWGGEIFSIEFQIENTGNVPVEFTGLSSLLDNWHHFGVDLWNQRIERIHFSTIDSPTGIIILPGEILNGSIWYSPIVSSPGQGLEPIVRSYSFALNYQQVQ